jgi:hypothetical protein
VERTRPPSIGALAFAPREQELRIARRPRKPFAWAGHAFDECRRGQPQNAIRPAAKLAAFARPDATSALPTPCPRLTAT